ncbi:FYVE zinc finger domain-containing protein [Candidatus Bathyarchaeota archaeon]|nr:FYVE zinc finger domain-containing protein [Candidatus Bathyarchaeota archaeon]
MQVRLRTSTLPRPLTLADGGTCRKCGRVVCHACSPHRITIPHQYIVRQPGQARPSQPYPTRVMGDDGIPYISGGERVRLCNPCVPDPNTSPPLSVTSPTQGSPRPHHRSQSSLGSGIGAFTQAASNGLYLQSPTHETHPRGRSVTMASLRRHMDIGFVANGSVERTGAWC